MLFKNRIINMIILEQVLQDETVRIEYTHIYNLFRVRIGVFYNKKPIIRKMPINIRLLNKL
jgi:hypothetical protein